MSRRSDPAVLVTGATGFIGRHLVTRLLVAGRRVVILARRHAGLTGKQRVGEIFGELYRQSLEIVEGDLANPIVLRSEIVDLGFMRQLARTGRGADANLMGSRYVK